MCKKILIISDIHGKWNELNKIIQSTQFKEADMALALGDVGIGFDKKKDPNRKFPPNFKFIVGNHDDRTMCQNHPNYLGDFGYNKQLDLFWMGGAASIDAKYRIEGVSWWRNEELSSAQMQAAFNLYAKVKPKYVITHDCPFFLYDEITSHHKLFQDVSYSTPKTLQAMWVFHRPKMWFFAHHHRNFSKNFQGTRFICLNELGAITLEISKTTNETEK